MQRFFYELTSESGAVCVEFDKELTASQRSLLQNMLKKTCGPKTILRQAAIGRLLLEFQARTGISGRITRKPIIRTIWY